MWGKLCVFGLLLVLSSANQSDSQCSMTRPCVEELGQGQPFVEPVQLGYDLPLWMIDLSIDIGEIQFGWLKLKRRMYNGQIAGPTWNVKQGDKIIVTVRNHLSNENNYRDIPHNLPNHPNTTNLHTHGLHISSDSPQDNVQIRIEPGETFQYFYDIHENNPAGTLWYHAHLHLATNFQVQSGMSGLLIVDDPLDKMTPELSAASCPNNCDKDIQMLFQPLLQYRRTHIGFAGLQERIQDNPLFRQDDIITEEGIPLSQWMEENLDLYATNGRIEPVLEIQTGHMHRFRMVNAGGLSSLELFITEKGTIRPTTACQIREISVDGVYLNEPRMMHQGQTFLSPGGRADWLVKCNIPGTYELRSHPMPENKISLGVSYRFEGLMVTIVVAGPSPRRAQEFPHVLPERPYFVGDLRDIDESEITERFVVELNTAFHLNREKWEHGPVTRYKMTVDTIQEWHLINSENKEPHPLHIHVNHFQVIAYNKYTGGFSIRREDDWVLYDQDDHKSCYYQRAALKNRREEEIPEEALQFIGHDERFKLNNGNTLGYSRLGDWRDTVMVPPLSNITIRFIPERYTGAAIVHCHILAHEDEGMMITTDIVKKGESREAVIKSGDAYPGTCRRCDRYPFNNPKTLCEEAQDGKEKKETAANNDGDDSGISDEKYLTSLSFLYNILKARLKKN